MTPGRVVVVGLGPAGPDLLTTATLHAIGRIGVRFVRTTRHPSSPAVEPATSFDDVYVAADDLESVYAGIVQRLEAAAMHGEVLYAVPGSPAVAERSVELLRAGGRVEVEVLAALSFLDLAWVRIGVDPVAAGVRVIDGHRFAVEAAGERGPLLVAQCDSRTVLSEVKLAFGDGAPAEVVVLQRLGMPDEAVTTVAWADLDRSFEPDHLTSLWIPQLAAPVAAELAGFAEVVRRLREECPWDRGQTHQSLARHVVEEAYEVVEAIGEGDPDHLAEELGDLLLQVFLHAAIAAQVGSFDLADVARGVSEKMVRRHPHVFAGLVVADADEVGRNWERIKAAERSQAAEQAGGAAEPAGAGRTAVAAVGRRRSALDGVAGSLPSLLHAAEVGKRAAKVGFDWRDAGPAYDKVDEELAELRADPTADELGDLLFAVVDLGRHIGHDPESALRAATAKFRRRFAHVERSAEDAGIDLATADVAELARLWDAAKHATAGGGEGPAGNSTHPAPSSRPR